MAPWLSWPCSRRPCSSWAMLPGALGGEGQRTLCFLSPSWPRPSGVRGVPFSVHHFLLHSAPPPYLEKGFLSVWTRGCVCAHPGRKEGSRGQKTPGRYGVAQSPDFLFIGFAEGVVAFSSRAFPSLPVSFPDGQAVQPEGQSLGPERDASTSFSPMQDSL